MVRAATNRTDGVMRQVLKTIGIASVIALVAAAGVTVYMFSSSAESATIEALEAPRKAERTMPGLELAQAVQPPTPLPGGASSLNETYKDWAGLLHIAGKPEALLDVSAAGQSAKPSAHAGN